MPSASGVYCARCVSVRRDNPDDSGRGFPTPLLIFKPNAQSSSVRWGVTRTCCFLLAVAAVRLRDANDFDIVDEVELPCFWVASGGPLHNYLGRRSSAGGPFGRNHLVDIHHVRIRIVHHLLRHFHILIIPFVALFQIANLLDFTEGHVPA